MEKFTKNPIVVAAVRLHSETNKRIECSVAAYGEPYFTIVLSGNTLYVYDENHELIATAPTESL